jgi:hypothetical protein
MAKRKSMEPDGRTFLAALDHPLRRDYEKVRAAVRAVDPSIQDGVKWNSLSFRTSEWFATVNLRSRDSVQLVFHLGAKARPDAATKGLRAAVADPEGLVKWLAKERALVTLGKGKALDARRAAFAAIVRAWIGWV